MDGDGGRPYGRPPAAVPGLPPARNRRLPLAMGQPAWEALFFTIIPFSSVGAA